MPVNYRHDSRGFWQSQLGAGDILKACRNDVSRQTHRRTQQFALLLKKKSISYIHLQPIFLVRFIF